MLVDDLNDSYSPETKRRNLENIKIKASFEFADGKPLELLGGSNLLYLLKEYAGVEARIVMPEDRKDPQPDPQGE